MLFLPPLHLHDLFDMLLTRTSLLPQYRAKSTWVRPFPVAASASLASSCVLLTMFHAVVRAIHAAASVSRCCASVMYIVRVPMLSSAVVRLLLAVNFAHPLSALISVNLALSSQ